VKTILLWSIAALSLFGIVSDASAAIVGITSLSGNDSIDWSQLGPAFTGVSSPQGVSSVGGLAATVSSGSLERLDEGNGWSGNFTGGTPLLWATGAATTSEITLNFAHPVLAVGAQIQFQEFGVFTAQVLGGDGVDLGTFTEGGLSTSNGDGSAIFIGLSSNIGDITQIQFSLTNNGAFAIGTVELQTLGSGVPEPSTWAMMLVGFAGLGFAGFRKTRARSVPALSA